MYKYLAVIGKTGPGQGDDGPFAYAFTFNAKSDERAITIITSYLSKRSDEMVYLLGRIEGGPVIQDVPISPQPQFEGEMKFVDISLNEIEFKKLSIGTEMLDDLQPLPQRKKRRKKA